MKIHDQQFIAGKWVASHSGELVDVTNAATEEVIARVPAMNCWS
jgi:acyl-CoA reductase-like NAD-dependent aldehyde dehydrogenase